MLPWLALYEVGVIWLGGSDASALRTGVDAWVRHGLATVGLTDRWLPPLVLVLALLGWQVFDRRQWRFRPRCLVAMAMESLVLAVALIGLSRLVDLGLARLEDPHRVLSAQTAMAPILGYVGAGVYEEAIFRLALVPLAYGVFRVFQAPKVLASTLAVTGSALLFSMAHHAGTPGEAFTWYAFIFRWMAGVYFAWVFVVRGFGIAVGTHAAYDILVGWLDWHL